MGRKTSALRAAAGHLTMGLALGGVLAAGLLLGQDAWILHMIMGSASPRLGLAVFVGVLASMIGVGATLTGFLFQAIEDP